MISTIRQFLKQAATSIRKHRRPVSRDHSGSEWQKAQFAENQWLYDKLCGAESNLEIRRYCMARSGAPPDALREIDDDLRQVHLWMGQCASTIDERVVCQTLRDKRLTHKLVKEPMLRY